MADSQPPAEYLYHYTTRKNLAEILREKIIRQESGQFGIGVYLTAMKSSNPIDKLAANNYTGPGESTKHKEEKTECYIKIPLVQLPNAKVQPSGRNVWKHEGDIHLNNIAYEFGDTEIVNPEDQLPEWLYHYTTKENLARILSMKKISQTSGRYGYGVYLTAMKPSNPTSQIARNNYIGPGESTRHKEEKTECYIKIPRNQLPNAEVQPSERSVWKHEGDIYLANIYYVFGDTELINSEGQPPAECLYHYTTQENLTSILKMKKIFQTRGRFGDGVYFTAMKPANGTRKIALNNYDESDPEWNVMDAKTVAYIRIPLNRLWKVTVQSSGRNIWKHEGDVDLSRIPFQFGNTVDH